MTYQIVSKIVNGEEVLINAKGCEDLEINDLNLITYFSNSRSSRIIALNKGNIFKLTDKSYSLLKKDLIKRGILSRFNYSRKLTF